MLTGEDVRKMQLAAARDAARQHRTPLVLWPNDLDTEHSFRDWCKSMPVLGEYIPKGWKREPVDRYFLAYPYVTFFVDSSGWGNESEPAMTLDHFRLMLTTLIEREGFRFGLAVVSAGEFQVNIGLYTNAPVTRKARRKQ